MQSGANVILHERDHVIVSIRSPHNDEQLKDFCARVVKDLETNRSSRAILDLGGVDVLDSYSVRTLRTLCAVLRFAGTRIVIAGIPGGIAVSLVVRGLSMGDLPVVHDIDEALNT